MKRSCLLIELDDTLDALELNREQIVNSITLSHGLELARKEVLHKYSLEEYEL